MFNIKLPCLLVLISLNACASANGLDKKVPYPQAETGYQRQVIHLPPLPQENDAKLELQVGKTMQVDCNRHSFGAKLTEHSVQGWSYPYYHIDNLTGPISTRMACPPGTEKTEFVAAHGDQFMIRYNSKLPVVVYLPQHFELKYRIWHANPERHNAHPE